MEKKPMKILVKKRDLGRFQRFFSILHLEKMGEMIHFEEHMCQMGRLVMRRRITLHHPKQEAKR